MPVQRTCRTCGIQFETTRPNRKFCTEEHRRSATSRALTVSCKRCGKGFKRPGPGFYKYCDSCNLCGLKDCGRTRTDGNWCDMHSMRVVRRGLPGPAQKLPNNPKAGQGGLNAAGYHLLTVDGKKVPAHRIVMEQLLGRPLLPRENVHHINGVKDDNRPENLELWSTFQPRGQRVSDKVAWAIELLKLYAPERLADGYSG